MESCLRYLCRDREQQIGHSSSDCRMGVSVRQSFEELDRFSIFTMQMGENGVKVTKLNTFVIKLGKEMASLRKMD